jgi:PAS domain-containing protein
MKTNKGQQEMNELRHRATKLAFESPRSPKVGNLVPGLDDAHRLIQELEIHQIELELQAEELRLARDEAERALARYTELFEFAPVGYLNIDRWGIVRQANLFAFRLLGVERSALIGMRLDALISAKGKLLIDALLTKAFEYRTKQSCETVIQRGERESLTAEIVALVAEDGQECRVIITDIGERNHTQEMSSIQLELKQFAVAHSRGELLRRALDEIERMTGSLVTACYLFDDEQRTLVRAAWSTHTLDQFRPPSGAAHHYGLEKAGVWAACVKQRRPIVDNAHAWSPQEKGLLEFTVDVLRQLVVPIFRNGKIVALVGVANKTTDFSEDDLKTVAYLADVAWEIAEHKDGEVTASEPVVVNESARA